MIDCKLANGVMDIHVQAAKLDASNAEAAKAGFRTQEISGVKQARIHLAELTFIDSSGVGVLLSIYKAFQQVSATVSLVQPRPEVLSVLELLRLHRIFTIEMD